MAETIVRTNGVEICAETFGQPTDPAVLLIMGASASMMWWPEPFRRMLASAGRFVIRGTHDPVLPHPHGEASAQAIPDARLMTLEGTGHERHPDDWERIVEAIASA